MANIQDYLTKILKERYGKDVRQSIHDAIQQCYLDGKAGSIDLQARESIEALESAKLDKSGDTANNITVFSSGDNLSPTGWANIEKIESGETHASLFRKFSLAVKNLRYLYKMLGTTDISAIGDGTVTGAISGLNNNLIVYATEWEILTEFNENCTMTIKNISLPSGIYFVSAYSHLGEAITDGIECTPSANIGLSASQSFIKNGQVDIGYKIASWSLIVNSISSMNLKLDLWCNRACKIKTSYEIIRLKSY